MNSVPLRSIAGALFCTILVATTAWGQPGRGGYTGGSVAGSVIDRESGEVIPGTAIALWKSSDSTLVTGTVTGADGTFEIAGLPPGKYYVKVSSIGFALQTIPSLSIAPGSMNVDLGTIALEEQVAEGEDVVVMGERSDVTFKSDKTVYNVENQPLSAGGNAVDVLKNVPQIEVDIDDNVSLRGSQNVAVHINGRPVPISGDALAAFLKSLPAEMIKEIEVIPNPSAKYDPDGMAGIINIVLKEKKEGSGTSGTISLTGGLPESFSGTGSINWRTAKTNLFSSYNFRHDNRNSNGEAYRENKFLSPVSVLEEESNSDYLSNSHVLNTTFDYTFDPVNSLTLTSLVSLRNSDGTSTIDYLQYDKGDVNRTATERQSPSEGDGYEMDYSLTYRWIKQPSQHEFSAEARYYTEDDDNTGSYVERLQGEIANPDSVVLRQQTNNSNANMGGTFRLDYTRPLGEKGRLETGYKGDLRRINNSIFSESANPVTGSFEPDVNLNNEFIYDEQIHALYGTYGHTFGKLDGQIGLRAEQALTDFDLQTTDSTYENNYFSLFPSASLSYSLSETSTVRASYSRRINRPGVWQLNPFPQYEDRLNLRIGNPALKPEYIDAIELGFNKFFPWGTFSLSPYFRHSSNLVERWLTIDSSTGITTVSWENFASTDSYGAEAVATFRIKNRIRGFVNGSLYQFDLDGSNIEATLSNNTLGWSASANVSATLLPWLELQTNYFYRAPINISRGKIDAFHSADAALKASFLKDRASLSLRVSDIFNTMRFSLIREDETYLIDVNHKWQSRRASLTFSYTFGQQDQSQMRRQRRDDNQGGGGGTPAGVGF